jgi:signal-transduction protein with cAMP-binding, CBS, and nucleotidyltransferase domain
MIEIELLEKIRCVQAIQKSETIFEIDHLATHYYQIISGAVKMNNFNGEFIQVFLCESQFGEPSLFLDRNPALMPKR